QALLLVRLLELGGELRAAVDLRDANGKGHAMRQGVHCLKTNIQGIDLKQVTGAGNRVLLGLRKARHRGGSARRGASPPGACAGVRPAVPWRFIWVRMRPTHGSRSLPGV